MCYSRLVLIFFYFLFISLNTTAAGIHKWVDEHGRVHYGDKPVNAATSEKLDIKNKPSKEPATNGSRLEKQQKLLDAMEASRKERLDKQAEKQAIRDAKKKHKKQCAEMRNDLIDYGRGGIGWYVVDDNGERRFLTNDELEDRKRELRESLQKNCGDKFEKP
jgi:hypothetical protein